MLYNPFIGLIAERYVAIFHREGNATGIIRFLDMGCQRGMSKNTIIGDYQQNIHTLSTLLGTHTPVHSLCGSSDRYRSIPEMTRNL